MTCRLIPTTAALIVGLAMTSPVYAASEGGVELGYLECQLSQDEGNVIVSELTYSCAFNPNDDSRPEEFYKATSDKLGIDLSKTHRETLRWAVLAAGEPEEPGALAGDYGGISADASVGAGVGAKALVGGFEDTITLQPVSVTTQEGYGLSLAIESMHLDFVGTGS